MPTRREVSVGNRGERWRLDSRTSSPGMCTKRSQRPLRGLWVCTSKIISSPNGHEPNGSLPPSPSWVTSPTASLLSFERSTTPFERPSRQICCGMLMAMGNSSKSSKGCDSNLYLGFVIAVVVAVGLLVRWAWVYWQVAVPIVIAVVLLVAIRRFARRHRAQARRRLAQQAALAARADRQVQGFSEGKSWATYGRYLNVDLPDSPAEFARRRRSKP